MFLIADPVESCMIMVENPNSRTKGSVSFLNTRERILTIRLIRKLEARPEAAARLCREESRIRETKSFSASENKTKEET